MKLKERIIFAKWSLTFSLRIVYFLPWPYTLRLNQILGRVRVKLYSSVLNQNFWSLHYITFDSEVSNTSDNSSKFISCFQLSPELSNCSETFELLSVLYNFNLWTFQLLIFSNCETCELRTFDKCTNLGPMSVSVRKLDLKKWRTDSICIRLQVFTIK